MRSQSGFSHTTEVKSHLVTLPVAQQISSVLSGGEDSRDKRHGAQSATLTALLRDGTHLSDYSYCCITNPGPEKKKNKQLHI